jgi:hypothetical protein
VLGEPFPSLEEIRATVTRMEAKLSASASARTRDLLALYRPLVPRFEHDLKAERDVLLSRAGVLMLIQAADQERAHGE